MDPNSSGEGVTSVSSSIKRGLSVDSAQEVKRFRTATGAISTVRAWARAAGGSFIQELGMRAGRHATPHEARAPAPWTWFPFGGGPGPALPPWQLCLCVCRGCPGAQHGQPWGGPRPGRAPEHAVPHLQVFGRSQSLPGADSLLAKPIDKQHTDTVVNFLIRVACQVCIPASPLGSFRTRAARRLSAFSHLTVRSEKKQTNQVWELVFSSLSLSYQISFGDMLMFLKPDCVL